MPLPFTAEAFLTSFSMPHFTAHAATVAIGKRDVMGPLRVKSA
jgi:hypothetical protein